MLESPGHSALSPAMIEGFARRARERIRGHEGGYRRDHLRALAQRVEVADDAIRIMGSKTELLKTLIAGQGRQSAAIGVPRGGLKWRTGWDSNPRERCRYGGRSEEHTSELQSLMRISYAVFCLKKKNRENHTTDNN